MMMEVNGGFFFKKKTPKPFDFFLIIRDSEPRTPGRAVSRKKMSLGSELQPDTESNMIYMIFFNLLYARYHITFQIFKVSINIEWIL